MSTPVSQQRPFSRLTNAALAPGRSLHERQRDLVRASLLARPGQASTTHRRWA